ncbi:ComF family protein [bacterium]|nr:ComF family protein [bacterium]
MKRAKRLLKFLLDVFFPKLCIGCRTKDTFLCEDCFSLIEINPYRYCFCQIPKRLIGKYETCSSCPAGYLNRIYSATNYDNKIVKKVISELKYRFQLKDLSIPLTILILLHLKETGFDFKSEMIIVPVPIHKSRERWRGFNQSRLIAELIAKATNTPYCCHSLIKIKKTKPQVGLKRKERQENIKGCFSITDSSVFKDKTVLLIDDVYTTGATMEECAKVLKEAGAKYVYGITVAREVST